MFTCLYGVLSVILAAAWGLCRYFNLEKIFLLFSSHLILMHTIRGGQEHVLSYEQMHKARMLKIMYWFGLADDLGL